MHNNQFFSNLGAFLIFIILGLKSKIRNFMTLKMLTKKLYLHENQNLFDLS